MDFIEQLFGISPDGGDGSLEAFWFAGIVIAIAAVAFRRRIVRRLASLQQRRR